jgi:hypothetical protein
MSAVDPTDPQTSNRYTYLRNSPLNNVDPQGLDGWDDWGGGWGGWDGDFGESLGIPTGIVFGGQNASIFNPCDFLACGSGASAGSPFTAPNPSGGSGTTDSPYIFSGVSLLAFS